MTSPSPAEQFEAWWASDNANFEVPTHEHDARKVWLAAFTAGQRAVSIEQQDKWHKVGYEDGQRVAWEAAVREVEMIHIVQSQNPNLDAGFEIAKNSALANLRRRATPPDHQERGR